MCKKPICVLPVLVLFCLLGASSCSKSDRSKDTELQSARDMSLALSGWNDVFRQLQIIASQDTNVNVSAAPAIYTGCTTVSVTPAHPSLVYPKTMIINYGSADCKGPDGALRKGRLIVVFSGNFRDSLTTITVTPSNYTFNDAVVDGTYTLTNNGRNAAGNYWFTETVVNSTCTVSNRSTIYTVAWSANFKKEWIQGAATPYVFDDVYQITGTASGTSSDNNSFGVFTSAPLQFAMNCPWLEKGNLYLKPANIANRYIDFGTGACDNQADVWIFGYKYTLYQY